jgi:hypothetical protein
MDGYGQNGLIWTIWTEVDMYPSLIRVHFVHTRPPLSITVHCEFFLSPQNVEQ